MLNTNQELSDAPTSTALKANWMASTRCLQSIVVVSYPGNLAAWDTSIGGVIKADLDSSGINANWVPGTSSGASGTHNAVAWSKTTSGDSSSSQVEITGEAKIFIEVKMATTAAKLTLLLELRVLQQNK